MFELRDYQVDAIHDLRQAIRAGSKRPLLVAPTGAGKTVIAAQIVRAANAKNRQVMFLAHRRELVNQAADKLASFGVEHGVIMAGEELHGGADCQVASIDTLRARCINSDRLPLPYADVLVIDEAHRSLAATYLEIIKRYPHAIVLGITATPIRGDGKGLGHIYDDMIQCPTVQQLTDLGHLVPAITFAPTIPDLTGIKIKGGDYDPVELEARMNRRELVGDIVTHWHRLANDRATVVFASGVKHSINLRDEFAKQGVSVAHVDGDTNLRDRNNMVRDLRSGALQVICNYGVLTEGFDEPRLAAAVLARATKNLGLCLQMAGRTLRPCEAIGKTDTRIIDHSGNVYEHGFVADNHNWVLEEGKALVSSNADRQRELDEREPITCIKCATVYHGQLICPHCGYLPEKKGKHVESRSGELMEVRVDKRLTAKKKVWTATEKEEWFNMFLQYGREKEYKNPKGWASHKYKAKFKDWPEWEFSEDGEEPSPECLSYIRSRNIAYAKAKEKEKQIAAGSG